MKITQLGKPRFPSPVRRTVEQGTLDNQIDNWSAVMKGKTVKEVKRAGRERLL